jgi:hypothetical protein
MKGPEKDSDIHVPRVAERVEALATLARTSSSPMSPVQLVNGLHRVSDRLRTPEGLRLRELVLAMLALATAGATTAWVVRSRPERAPRSEAALAYHVESGEIGYGGYIHSEDPAGPRVRFEEGTELHLLAGARGRLTSVSANGARLAIEEGEAEVSVTHRPGARWLVDAGPFSITVHGTAFTAAWDGSTERLDIQMMRGLVTVSGPVAEGLLTLREGQHLSVNVRTKEVILREIPPPPTEESKPGGAPTSSHGLDEGVGAEPPRAPAEPARAEPQRQPLVAGTRDATRSSYDWSTALAAGKLEMILRDADRRGMSHVLATASSGDLAALGDAARYQRQDALAARVLLTERRRFPSSERASDAAFLLGRLEEGHSDGDARAIRWYDVYLSEAPLGTYSSEALGRKMTATERTQGVLAAGVVAEEYLRRFPNGIHAGAARVRLQGQGKVER